MNLKLQVFIFTLFCCLDVLAVQDSGRQLDGWFTIREGKMVPVTSLDDHTLVYLSIKDYTGKDSIRICHDSEIDLWINNQLYYRGLPKGCETFLKAELENLADTDSVILSISYERYANLSAALIKNDEAASVTFSASRAENPLSNFYLMSLMIILITVAMLKYTFPNKFTWLISNPFASRTTLDLDELYTGFWHLENLFMSLIFSMFVALQVIYFNQELGIWPLLNTWGDQYFIQWLFITGLVFSFLFVKYVFSWLMSTLLQTRSLPNIQFQDFIQIFIWISMISIGLFFIDLYMIEKIEFMLVDLAYLLTIGVLLAFQLWLYFKFVKYYSHKKLLIISYLCTTEILPVFLIIFWLVK